MEKPEYFVVNPSVKLFGGVRVAKDTEFETYNDDKTVHQTLKNLTLTTEINKETEQGDMKHKEHSTMESTIPEGTVLIWSEETGYIIPNYHMVKVEEAINNLQGLLEITEPIEKGNKDESKGE